MLAATSGCRLVNGYRQVTILVQDAETGQPIPSARVRAGYYLLVDPRAPRLRMGLTDDDGKVTLRMAPYEGRAVVVATADGYFTEGMRSLSDGVIRDFDLHNGKAGRDFVVLEMYAEPMAVVELIVPAGYQGLFEVRVRADEEPRPERQRHFRASVPRVGVAVVEGAAPASEGRVRRLPGPLRGRACPGVSTGRRGGRLLGTRGKREGHAVLLRGHHEGVRRRLSALSPGNGRGRLGVRPRQGPGLDGARCVTSKSLTAGRF